MTVQWNDTEFLRKVETSLWAKVEAVAEKVRFDGNALILEPPKSGRIYHRKGRPPHQASAPFEAPANDTGALIASSRVLLDKSTLTATANWPLDYAYYLAFGTRFMSARPFPQMALSQNADLLYGLDLSGTVSGGVNETA